MIGAIGSVNNRGGIDQEYQRIMYELGSLGLQPTGDKGADKARLEAEKGKIVDKINEKIDEKTQAKGADFQEAMAASQQENMMREKLEEQRLGAMTVAELNKIYFNLQ